ncbi:MAG: TonB-dependent receptor [Methylococcales bacterium]|nr:TonB-dependent receptor [Methylococcales bacterium]
MGNTTLLSLIAFVFTAFHAAYAEDDTEEKPSASPVVSLEEVVVTGQKVVPVVSTQDDMSSEQLTVKQAQVSDTAKLMEDSAGVSFQTNGGVTALPVIHGLNDDRVKIEINGMLIPAACPNHMNPTLSYIDPSSVGSIKLLKGVTPVSMGGDSIGGTISVQTAAPVFAEPGKDILIDGKVSSFFRSNGTAFGGSVATGVANANARLDYTGSYTQSGDYTDGNGSSIKSSSYYNQNQAAALSLKFDKQLLEIKGGQEHVPFQGYPNARMEMTNNIGTFGNIRHRGEFDWGNLDTRAFLEDSIHAMNFGPDQLAVSPGVNMPMDTRARNLGYKVQAEIPLDQQGTVRFGNEFYANVLNDFWPAVCTSVSSCGGPYAFGNMGPNTLINLNNATRDRLGTFAEWESNWSSAWKAMLGFRYDHTMTDTGDVQGYNGSQFLYANQARQFNAKSHQRNFDTFDLTTLMQYTPNQWSQYEFGYARKNRAPSLYELYTWNTSQMVMTMIGWFGDGNGYVGNLKLKPETAHNITFTAEYYDSDNNAWDIKATPYFSYVENFIDADRCVTCTQPTNGFYYMQIANHNAWLWGGDVTGRSNLFTDPAFGQFSTHTIMSYVRGQRTDGSNLYHMMPFNIKLSLDHQLDIWNSGFEMQFVGSKNDVQALRGELQTPSYILLNAKTGFQWRNLSINAGVDNLLDKEYFYPLGGSYIGNYYTMDLGSTPTPNNNLAGMGRSVYVGMTYTY